MKHRYSSGMTGKRFDMQEHALQENKEKEVPTQPLTHPNVVKSGGYTPCGMDYIINKQYIMSYQTENLRRKSDGRVKNESMSRPYQKGEGQGKVRRKKAGNGHRKRSHKGGREVQQAVMSIPRKACKNHRCSPIQKLLQWRKENIYIHVINVSVIQGKGGWIKDIAKEIVGALREILCRIVFRIIFCNPYVMNLPQQEPQVQEVQMPVPPSDSIKALNGTSSWSPIGDPKTFTIPLQ